MALTFEQIQQLAEEQAEQDRLVQKELARREQFRLAMLEEYMASECTRFTLPESKKVVNLKYKNAITPKLLIEYDLVPCTLVNAVNRHLAYEYNLPPPSVAAEIASEEGILYNINELSNYLLPEDIRYADVSELDAWAIRQYVQGQLEQHISEEYIHFACGPYKLWMQSFHEAPYIIIDKIFPELSTCPVTQYDMYMAGASYRYFFTADDKAQSLEQMATILGIGRM